jgi:hypothetical protein
MRDVRLLVVIAIAAGACQRRKAESEQRGLEAASGWVAAEDATPGPRADGSPCVEECVARSRMRATAPEHILAECMAECGVTVEGGLAEMPDLTLRVPAEALQDLPRCARLAGILSQIAQCPDLDVAVRHQLKGVVEAMVEQLGAAGATEDAESRRQLEQRCRLTAIDIGELMRTTPCRLERGGGPP